MLDEDALHRCRDAMDRVYAGEYRTTTRPRHGWPDASPDGMRLTVNAWWADPDIATAVLDPYLARCAAMLLGVDSIRLWEDQLLLKPGNDAERSRVGWHQDWHYWAGSVSTPDMCTAWIALDDVGAENGALRVLDGTHTWPTLRESSFHEQATDSQRDALRTYGDAEQVVLKLEAGAFSIHHCKAVHGSGLNHTERPRRAIAVHYMRGDARAVVRADHAVPHHQNWELLRHLGLGEGDDWDGVYWPRLYPPPAARPLGPSPADALPMTN